MFLCKSIGIYGTVQNTRSQIFTLFNITLDLGASPLIVKKLWQQQQLSWSQKLQILFPTWFPEVIFLQVTSKTRRRYSVRGSQVAPSGAALGSRKKSILKRQMVVTDEGEISIV